MKSFYSLVFLLLSLSISASAKMLPKETQQKLSENGVLLQDDSKIYTEHQYYLLSSFDFDGYRNYASKRMVQIEDGPLIELVSLSEMQQSGKNISPEYMDLKKNEMASSNLKSIVTKINIGFRYGPKKNTETGF